MNLAERDVELLGILDRLQDQEQEVRRRKAEAAGRGDGPMFKKWADILNGIRRAQERAETELLAGVENALEEDR